MEKCLQNCDTRHREISRRVHIKGNGSPHGSACLNVTTFGVTTDVEWDEAKNRANIRKHGLDFAWAEQMFHGPLFVRPDTREDYGEER